MNLRLIHVTNEVLSHLLDAGHYFIKIKLFFSLLNKEILRQPVINYIISKPILLMRRCWMQVLDRLLQLVATNSHPLCLRLLFFFLFLLIILLLFFILSFSVCGDRLSYILFLHVPFQSCCPSASQLLDHVDVSLHCLSNFNALPAGEQLLITVPLLLPEGFLLI